MDSSESTSIYDDITLSLCIESNNFTFQRCIFFIYTAVQESKVSFFLVCLCVIKWTSVERLHSLYTHPEHKHRQLHWIMTYIRAPATATKRWNHLHTKRVVVNICNGMCILVFVCVCHTLYRQLTSENEAFSKRITVIECNEVI